MFKNFDIAVDTTKGIRNQAISVNTNDLQTLQFSFIITQSGVPVNLTGATVRLAVKKPDKKTVFQDCTITDAVKGKCEIILDTQAYIVPGLHPVELMIYYAADKVSVTGRFSYTANKGILDDSSVVSTNEFQSINKAITDVESIVVDLRDNGTGIDAQARSELETVTTQLADTGKQVNGIVNIKQYNVVGNGVVGDSDSIQAMIDSLRQASISSNLSKQYTVKLPSGKYIIDKEIKMSPYVKIKPLGYVEFCITHNGTGFWITPSTGDLTYNNSSPDHLNKNSWNRGKYFDGSEGAIVFTSTLDNDDPLTKTIAIEIGSRNAGSLRETPISRYVMDNVNVYGLDTAIKFNCVNNYIGTLKHCHLELNNHALHFTSPNGTQINSGENMVFDNCIIAISKKEAVLIDVPGHDLTFHNSSFDFNASPVFKSLKSGTCIRLNNSYIEKIGDGVGAQLIYSSESTNTGETGGRNSFYIKNTPIFVERASKLFENLPNSGAGYINLHLDIDGLELRYAETKFSAPYSIGDRFIVDSPKVFLRSRKILNMSITKSVVSKELNLLRNGDLALSTPATDLTVASSDVYWEVTGFKTGVSNPTIVAEGVGGSNCIKYNVTNTTDNQVTFTHKLKYNVEAGENLLFSALVKTDKISSRNEFRYILECYDQNDVLMQTLTYYDYFGVPATVTTVDGTQFRMIRDVATFYIPPGVFKVKPIFKPVLMDGTFLCVDELHLSKSK